MGVLVLLLEIPMCYMIMKVMTALILSMISLV